MPPTASGPLGSVHFLRHWNGRTADVVVRLILRGTSTAEENDVNDAPTPKRLCAAAAAPPRSSAHDDDDKPQLGEQTIKESGEKQEEEPTHAQPSGGPGRVLREVCAHSLLLTEGSDYLASRLEGPWSEEQPQGVVDVLLESEGEEEAAMLVLKTMYCPTDVASPLRGQSQQTLLQVLKLADRLGAEHCMAAACTALKAGSSTLEWATAMALYNLPPSCTAHPACAALRKAVSATLLAQLGDLDAAWQDAQKAQMLLDMPWKPLQILLSSKHLRGYEETVVYTLAAWLEANPGCSAEERGALGACLRLPHMDPLYLATVVSPLLPALVPSITATDVHLAAVYGAGTPELRRILTTSGPLRGGRFSSWELPRRPASICGNVLECRVPVSLLRAMHAEALGQPAGSWVYENLPSRLVVRGLER